MWVHAFMSLRSKVLYCVGRSLWVNHIAQLCWIVLMLLIVGLGWVVAHAE